MKGAAATLIFRSGLFADVANIALVGGCDGTHANEGEPAGTAAGNTLNSINKGRDGAKQVRSPADTQADALNGTLTRTAKHTLKAREQQAAVLFGK